MSEHLPEHDWKRWQQLAPELLNRFCDSAVANAFGDATSGASGHEKFLALYRFIDESNADIAVVFNDRHRSNALIQIAAAVIRGIMSESELMSFSEKTQERVRMIVGVIG
jgi:UDP-N-acetylmuramyl tripeptide synthase